LLQKDDFIIESDGDSCYVEIYVGFLMKYQLQRSHRVIVAIFPFLPYMIWFDVSESIKSLSNIC